VNEWEHEGYLVVVLEEVTILPDPVGSHPLVGWYAITLVSPHHLIGTAMLGTWGAVIHDLGWLPLLDPCALFIELQSLSANAHVVGLRICRGLPLLPCAQSPLVLQLGLDVIMWLKMGVLGLGLGSSKPRSSRIIHRFAKSSALSFLRGLWFTNQYLRLGVGWGWGSGWGSGLGSGLGMGRYGRGCTSVWVVYGLGLGLGLGYGFTKRVICLSCACLVVFDSSDRGVSSSESDSPSSSLPGWLSESASAHASASASASSPASAWTSSSASRAALPSGPTAKVQWGRDSYPWCEYHPCGEGRRVPQSQSRPCCRGPCSYPSWTVSHSRRSRWPILEALPESPT